MRARAHRDSIGHDSRHAAAGAGAVRVGDACDSRGNIAPSSRRPPGPITVEFLPGQGAGARAQLPAARGRGCLRRHLVPPRRAGIRHPDGLADDARARYGEAAEARPPAAAGVQRYEARQGHPVDGARRRSRERDRPRSSSSRATRSSLDGKYTVFGRVVDGMAVIDAIEQTPVNGEAPVQRIDLKTFVSSSVKRVDGSRRPSEHQMSFGAS